MSHSPRRAYPVHHSYAEYLAVEEQSGVKHEFIDGAIFAMAGGSRRESALASRLSAVLEAARSPGCVAFQSDQRVRVLVTGRSYYPVEVLSPSTEEVDRADKWADYQLLPSLREYVLVAQDRPRLEIFRRLDEGRWEYREVTQGVATLAMGARLDLATLYADLPE